ncbi:hypothetical protein BH10PSE12_BH10PSE12_23600 [soil metagenome]
MSRVVLGVAIVLGIGAIANGIFMLVSPANWYFAVPGVTSTGPFNQHFVRDIGLIFAAVGAAFLLGVARPIYRTAAWGAAAIWLSGHALFHFWEVAVGICGPSALLRDFTAVTLPALLAVAITIHALSNKEPVR